MVEAYGRSVARSSERFWPLEDSVQSLRPLGEQVAELEARSIAAALRATEGNKLAAARLLRISRATLYGRLGE